VTVTAGASDDGQIAKVEFYVDNVLSSTDTAAPYDFAWNTTALAAGNHSLKAVATDDAGNQTISAAVSVTAGNSASPTTSVNSPGSPVAGTVTVSANANDDFGVTKVELYADGLLVGTDSTPPDWTFSWNTLAPALPAYDGEHALTTKAYDTHGQVTTSAPVTVTVDNRGSSWYDAQITTATLFPGRMDSPGAPYRFDVTVTNTGDGPLPASKIVLHSRWLSAEAADPIAQGPAVTFPLDLQPLQQQTVQVDVAPPTLPAGVARSDYRLRFDLYDTDNPSNPWFAAHGNQPLEEVVPVGVLGDEETLGIEPYFEYDKEQLGAGLENLVNVATGNSVVRWQPFHAPGIGLSTDVELTYNSLETGPPPVGCGPSHAHCPLGPGWSLAVSSLTRFGHQQFTIDAPGNPRAVTLNDAEGTVHRFTSSDGTHWTPPAGTHLYLRKFEPSVTVCETLQASWALTRPDRTTYYYATDGNHGWPVAVRDRNGNELCFTRSNPGDITTVKDEANRPFNLSYDAHLLQSIADHEGHTLVFSYANGRLASIVEVGGTDARCDNPQNRCFQFGYTGGRLTSVTDPRLNSTDFEYHPDGKLWHRFDREERLTTFTYNVSARETTVEKPLQRTTVYHHQPDKSVDWIRNPLFETTTYEWWPSRHMKKVTEPAPRLGYTEYTYDQNGLLTIEGVLTDANGPDPDEVSRTVYEYDHFQVDGNDDNQSISRLKTRTDPNGVATPLVPDDFMWQYFYTGPGQPDERGRSDRRGDSPQLRQQWQARLDDGRDRPRNGLRGLRREWLGADRPPGHGPDRSQR
jgi:YD repeat-containing protein